MYDTDIGRIFIIDATIRQLRTRLTALMEVEGGHL